MEGTEEYARLLAARATAQQRNRKIFAAVGAVALAVIGLVWYRDYQQKERRQKVLDDFERWAELDKRETGSFFTCAMASETDMNVISTAAQVQARIETAYLSQQKTFSEHLLGECVPKIERARQEFGARKETQPELAGAIDKYRATLPLLQSGIEEYAQALKNRQTGKGIDQLVQDYGNAWHTGIKPTPESVAFEKFIHCSVPGLAAMKDVQAMLEALAAACKKDAAVFWDRAVKTCGALLTELDPKATPSKTWTLSMKRFFESDARQLEAWAYCAKRGRKGKKVEDLAGFLAGVAEYMEARTEVVKAARQARESH